MSQYTQSYIENIEEYKGFVIEVEHWRFYNSKTMQFHRRCRLIKNGECIALGNTKKEMKYLIDHGCF